MSELTEEDQLALENRRKKLRQAIERAGTFLPCLCWESLHLSNFQLSAMFQEITEPI
jgi:hypothetical protein